ncbi:MAG: hypothetical protein DRP91_06035 [Candidatus Neomarinimicrobiota bacterium]|nr:MAG: hypothetical protein DRP91_06035 [Candidatus Neomarinimicrobiota bacterium]
MVVMKRFFVMVMFLLVVAWQLFPQAQEYRWLKIGSLHSWFSNYGAEIEIKGPNRAQEDGLRWPALFRYTDCLVAKALWIGTTDYYDRVTDITYPYKVIVVGPRAEDPKNQFIPVRFVMYGKYNHPEVYVDGIPATSNSNDIVDSVDASLKADRMIINVLHTYLGITVTRKIMAFSQQFHDNYFIYEYTFKNTGIVDADGTQDPRTLTDVVFYFQYRYAAGWEPFRRGWAPINNISWGRNSMNHVLYFDPLDPTEPFRVEYTWYGPHSKSKVYMDYGCPDPQTGRLGSVQYIGNIVLFAQKSPDEMVDDINQPFTTQWIGSDSEDPVDYKGVNYGADMYDPGIMTRRYMAMTAGRPQKSHAEEVGDGYADLWGTDPGGYSHGQGFGPYTLEPGDEIKIVIAEGVSGISRKKAEEVGRNWYRVWGKGEDVPLIMPDGSTTTDPDEYRIAWVKTGEDSLFQTLRRAKENFGSGYDIPQAPPPPDKFYVESTGDKILLKWSESAENVYKEHFGGYVIYRAVGKPDTFYEKIFECDKLEVASLKRDFDGTIYNVYEDRTPKRGFDYYYYIQTKDDGYSGVTLYSSMFWTVTNRPAQLKRPGLNTLEKVRVVPNPYHLKMAYQQFGVDAPDRIAFFNLPRYCKIRIYTERGDLINVIDHSDGTGTETWNLVTSSGQIVVSGIYIALIEASQDHIDESTGEILLRKGEKCIRKFVVIR